MIFILYQVQEEESEGYYCFFYRSGKFVGENFVGKTCIVGLEKDVNTRKRQDDIR